MPKQTKMHQHRHGFTSKYKHPDVKEIRNYRGQDCYGYIDASHPFGKANGKHLFEFFPEVISPDHECTVAPEILGQSFWACIFMKTGKPVPNKFYITIKDCTLEGHQLSRSLVETKYH